MQSSLFVDGEKYVVEGAAAANELSMNTKVTVEKPKKNVTDEKWKAGTPEEKKL